MAATFQVRLASAYEDYRHNRLESARSHLQGLKHPKVAHLLGMISRKQGRLVEAREHLEWAAREVSQDIEIATSLAQLYREVGEIEFAENKFREVVAATKANPASLLPAQLGLASLLIDRSEAEEALSVLSALPADHASANSMRGRAWLEAGDLDAARNALELSFNADPTAASLQTLAQVLWLAGSTAEFESLVVRASTKPGLGSVAVDIARSSNNLDWAWSVGLGVAAEKEDASTFRTSMAMLAVDRADAESAIALAGDVVRANPTFGPAVSAVLSAQLMLGATDKADILIKRMREAEPLGQHWIGYELLAARQRGADVSPLTTDLIGLYELPIPDGFDSIDAFNAAFAKVLSRLHGGHQQPLGQSLIGGTQTQRNLATYDDPVIKAYMKALRAPVAEHLQKLGTSSANPCSARNTGSFAINDCWSVTLDESGFHQSHVHPEGWLSSAYYVSVAAGAGREGWLKFGESPIALPQPQTVLKWVEPKPGMLALFPSYLWHGTQPVAAGGERLTAPFDVVPA